MADPDQFPEQPYYYSPGGDIQPSAARLGLLAAAEWHRACASIWARVGNYDKHQFHLWSASTLMRMSMGPAPKTGGTYLPDAAFQVRVNQPDFPEIRGLYLGQMRVGTVALIGGSYLAAMSTDDPGQTWHDTAEAGLDHLIGRVKEFIGAVQIAPALE